jgi:predicted nuclease of predicted toxin-antitoxin system
LTDSDNLEKELAKQRDWEEEFVEQRFEVRLLIDENLPRSLKSRLRDLFPGSAHVSDLDLLGAPDSEIWDRARIFNFAILTKDKDFAERVRLEGPPPVIVQIRAGNCPVWHLVRLIRESAERIRTGVQFGGPLIEIGIAAEAAKSPDIAG